MLKMLIEKLESYAFECEGGPLINCKDWQRLKKLVSEQNAATQTDVSARNVGALEQPAPVTDNAVNTSAVAAPDLVERLRKRVDLYRNENAYYVTFLDESLLLEAAAALAEREKLYMELIMAVANKYPNETRHETALRYILEREASSSDEAKCDALRSRS